MSIRLFTSESVTEGHPDKICDQISDSVLDALYKQDKNARVACETCCSTGFVVVMGEISTKAYVDIPKIARETILNIGYHTSDYGFDGNTCAVLCAIDEQSPDIALGVDNSFEKKQGAVIGLDNGAGDQGMMFGYACNETPELMPMPITLAHKLTKRLADVRKSKILDYLRPDGKSQVTIQYDGLNPVRVDTVVVSTQHNPDVSLEQIREDVKKHVIMSVLPENLIDDNTKYFINPTGRFVVGGPHGDSGLTGRKIIVDTYGGYSRHGGGCFSGKDATKVDRSASYMARYVAKNIVASNLAARCEIQLAYAIGVARPVAVFVDTFGTGVVSDHRLVEIVKEQFDLRPTAIIQRLELQSPIYAQTASYGHFGRLDLDLSWERTDAKLEI